MADSYTTPIDTFLEKASISTPRPRPAPKAPVVKKAAVTPVTRIPSTSTVDLNLSTKPNSVAYINATTSDDKPLSGVQSATAITAQPSAEPKTTDVEAVPASTNVGNGMDQSNGNIANENLTVPKANPKKRQRKPKDPSTSPESKRKKSSQPTQQGNINNAPNETNLETSMILLSLIEQNDGVFEFVPRLDLVYSSHVAKYHPTANPNVDGRTLVIVLDNLEKRGELNQIMISAETSTGTKQYKSILILPDVDPVTNPKVIAIRKELERGAALYQPRPVVAGKNMTGAITSLEAVRALCRSTPNAPIPATSIQTLEVKNSVGLEEPEVLEVSQNESRVQSETPSQSELQVQHRIMEPSKEHTPGVYTPDIPSTPKTSNSIQITEKPIRSKRSRKKSSGTP